jgi:hypothetical protein
MTGKADTAFPERYLTRDPLQWQGFEPLDEAVLTSRYTFAEGAGRTFRGESNCEYRFRALYWPGFDRPFQFHFAEGKLALIEADFWSLDRVTCLSVLDGLGKPDTRLDAILRMDSIERADWLYTARGLALCVMPETGLIARWTAFLPCSESEYRDRIRPVEQAREFKR